MRLAYIKNEYNKETDKHEKIKKYYKNISDVDIVEDHPLGSVFVHCVDRNEAKTICLDTFDISELVFFFESPREQELLFSKILKKDERVQQTI